LSLLARPAIPLRLSPQVSPSGWAGGDFPALTGFSFHQPFRQPTPDALLGHQLNETLRLFNLWMQVQKGSKFVDFTNVGACLRVLRFLRRDFAEVSKEIGKLRRCAFVFQLTFCTQRSRNSQRAGTSAAYFTGCALAALSVMEFAPA
jgi:hypothetical protein